MRSIGHIWLLWIRVRAFDWSDPDPDPLDMDRDLVNPDTVQYNRISRSTHESAGTVAVRLRTSCSSCSACSIRIQSSQINSTYRMRPKSPPNCRAITCLTADFSVEFLFYFRGFLEGFYHFSLGVKWVHKHTVLCKESFKVTTL